MNKNILFCGIILISISQNIIASEQFSDKLVYNGIEYEITGAGYPLESYFTEYPNKRPRGTNSAFGTLDRKYRANFKIINNELFLIDIEIISKGDKWESVFDEYFGEKIKIDTFTGSLDLINGKETGIYLWLTPIYENYITLEFDNGNQINEYNLNCFELLQEALNEFPKEHPYYKYISDKINELKEKY